METLELMVQVYGSIKIKPIILLVAIYSLIFHQSHKNATQMVMSIKKPITKAILLQTNSHKKQINSPDFSYSNTTGYMNNNSNTYTKWENKK